LKETDLVTQDSFTAWEQRFQGDLASDETANETKPTGKVAQLAMLLEVLLFYAFFTQGHVYPKPREKFGSG